jgi:hypothetical protein
MIKTVCTIIPVGTRRSTRVRNRNAIILTSTAHRISRICRLRKTVWSVSVASAAVRRELKTGTRSGGSWQSACIASDWCRAVGVTVYNTILCRTSVITTFACIESAVSAPFPAIVSVITLVSCLRCAFTRLIISQTTRRGRAWRVARKTVRSKVTFLTSFLVSISALYTQKYNKIMNTCQLRHSFHIFHKHHDTRDAFFHDRCTWPPPQYPCALVMKKEASVK